MSLDCDANKLIACQPYQVLGHERWSSLPSWLQIALSHDNALVSVLSTGLSNDNFRLSCEQGDWVLRDNHPHSLWCDRHHEIINWRLAVAAGLAPQLVWISDDRRFYLSQFITQVRPWLKLVEYAKHKVTSEPRAQINQAFQQVLQPERQEECPVGLLLSLLRQLMLLPVPQVVLTPRVQWQDYASRLNLIANGLSSQALASEDGAPHEWLSGFIQLQSLSTEIDTWLLQLESCLVANQYCHRDLNPHNLLLTKGKLLCIDFEYASASHPLFELASVIATHELTQAQVDSLTAQYLALNPNVNEFAQQAMPAAINYYWLCCAAWALLMAADSLVVDPQSQYLNYFKQYQQRIAI